MTGSRELQGNEVWRRLLDWTYGQAPSERLAASLLASDGYSSVDPSHPLGGPDGLKDAVCMKDGLRMIGASYFPRGQQKIGAIATKFRDDAVGIEKNGACGIVFVTNQELTLGERQELADKVPGKVVHIYHLERLAHLLALPKNYGIRAEFLQIDMTREELLAYHAARDEEHYRRLASITDALERQMRDVAGFATGGDSIVIFQPDQNAGRQQSEGTVLEIGMIALGDYPVYDINAQFNAIPVVAGGPFRVKKDVLYPMSFRVPVVEPDPTTKFVVQTDDPIYFQIMIQTRNKAYMQHLRVAKVDVGGGRMWAYASCILCDGRFDRKFYVSDTFPGYDPDAPLDLFDIRRD